jgi:dTDP-4-dehydrorhamnose reductase
MKLLITGANGQLGSELADCVKSRDDIKGIFVDRDTLDITDREAVLDFFSVNAPDYCINAAAYTNVEKAEEEQELAHAVNALGAENIATACAQYNTILFHISTDFVFDGKKTTPYTEEDEPHPLGAYARTKYEGERAVEQNCPRSFIVRTAWLYSTYGNNFVKTMLRLMKERESLSVVADQYGSPTYARDLAEALLKIIDVCERRRHSERSEAEPKSPDGSGIAGIPRHARNDGLYGIYHYANDGEVTWFEFAQMIRDRAGLSCELKPILASGYPSKVLRPSYSALSTKNIQRTFGVIVREWDESIEECLSLLLTDYPYKR